MSAMIDVVFLLLIFFILTKKPQIPEAHLAINLPSPTPSQDTSQPPPALLQIHVLPGPRYLLMGTKEQTLDQLGEFLKDTAAFSTDQTVIIKVDPEATESALVSVLDKCSEANLDQLNVMMLSP